MKVTEDYQQKLEQEDNGQLSLLGIALAGPKKQVNSLAGSFGLVR